MSQLSTYENPIIIPDDNERKILKATQELALKEGATVMKCPKYFLSQQIPNPQPYHAYSNQDAYVLLVILWPRHLLEPLLYILELFTRLFTQVLIASWHPRPGPIKEILERSIISCTTYNNSITFCNQLVSLCFSLFPYVSPISYL